MSPAARAAPTAPTRDAGRTGGPVRAAVVAVVALSLVVLAGCSTKQVANTVPTARGGTLHVLVDHRIDTWDPQRIAATADSAFAGRTYLRTLTTAAPAGAGFLPGLVADLATTTGAVSDGGRRWSFDLVRDAPWQDGRFITCADIVYGVSRSFARNKVAGGPTYAVDLLDIPTYNDPQGRVRSAYEGPYSGRGQAFFDRAVTCDGQTITFHLNQPRYDFGQIVSTPSFAPVRRDQDTARTDALSIFSSGPYMLEGVWRPGEGGRFVRNRKWISRDDPVRLAWPDVIEVEEALSTTTVVQRIIDSHGTDENAITFGDAPPSTATQLTTPALAARTTRPDSGVVDLLLTSRSSAALGSPAVRKAFATATDREAYVAADGGPMTPVTSALAPNIAGRPETNPLGPSVSGDPAAGRALLDGAGVALPVALRVGYRSDTATDRAVAALTGAWSRAGFAVTLVPLSGAPAGDPTGALAAGLDAVLSQAYGAWPSGGAVLPTLAARTGDPALAEAAAAAAALPDLTTRNTAWGALDTLLVASGDVVPLASRQRLLVRGSGVLAYQENVLLGGLPDLAAVEVTHTDAE